MRNFVCWPYKVSRRQIRQEKSVYFVMELCIDTNVHVFVDSHSGKYKHQYFLYKSPITEALLCTTSIRNYVCSCFVSSNPTCWILNRCLVLPYLYSCILDYPGVIFSGVLQWFDQHISLIFIWSEIINLQMEKTASEVERSTHILAWKVSLEVSAFCLVT